jgi:predicted transcriptional regulator
MAQQSSAGILMAIHATYAEQILSGRKTIEFRRQKPRIPKGTRIWLYATKGSLKAKTGAVGSFAADDVVQINAITPTQRTLRAGAVTRKLFDAYFHHLDMGWGIKVVDPIRLIKSVPTNQQGLQSYRWLQPRGKDRTLYYGHLRNAARSP